MKGCVTHQVPVKSAGPNNIDPRVLKETAGYLVVPSINIFRHSFEIGAPPLDWRSAHVVPIYKSGSRQCPNNYRPISLTSIIIKIFESIVKDVIFNHLKSHELISNMQFDRHLSCTVFLHCSGVNFVKKYRTVISVPKVQ